jgi:hypothetical protein
LIGDTISIGIAFCVYFFVLDKRTIGIKCPHCTKYILTNTPWICGVCQKKNLQTNEFPFIHRCEHKDCGQEPKAYKCHHDGCGELIFLTKDESSRNYAFCINPPTEPAEEEVERSDFERKKRRKEYKLHLTRLNMEVELAKQAEKDVKNKEQTPQGKIE